MSPDSDVKLMQKIKLAIVSEPGIAGVKRHVVDVLRQIDLNQFDVIYYYSLVRSDRDYPNEISEIERRGIVCHNISMQAEIHPLRDFVSLLKLLQRLWHQRPQILHLHSSKAGGIGRIASLFVFPRPAVLYTPHAMACYRSRIYLWLERILGFWTNQLVAVSASEKKDFIRWRIPNAARAETIILGVRMADMAKPSLRSPDPSLPCVVGACGRICFQKNALLFFQVALEMLKSKQDYRFEWIGDFGNDDEAKAVRDLLDRAGNPSQVEITGWIRDIRAHMEMLDIFCMLSRYESYGYVTAEAMLYGVPVLATPATGTIDLIRHEVTGLLVEPKVKNIVASIHLLQADATLRAQLAARGRQFIIENHTVDKMIEAIQSLYLTCIKNGR